LKVEWRLNPAERNNWRFTNASSTNPIQDCRESENRNCFSDDNFIGLAISGGGSRSAVFSAAVLFELQRYGILQQVDVISAVSGGSMTGAYYALSCDPPDGNSNCPPTVEGPERSVWQYEEVMKNLEKNYIGRWVGNWFWPDNIARTWFTYYDRTDIMAETFSDNLFDNSILGGEGFRFHDLNPQRPYLIVNATNNTRARSGERDLNFTFTREEFENIDSDLASYPIANAVTASGAFPAVFNYMTLKDFSKEPAEYIHLFDSGTSDNLGLTGLRKALDSSENIDEARVLVILIDADAGAGGKNPSDPDPRGPTDFIVDKNFLDTYETLMSEMRSIKVEEFTKYLEDAGGTFIHIKFEDLQHDAPDLFEVVSGIRTSYSIKKNDAVCLQHAARVLVKQELEKLCREEAWGSVVQPQSENDFAIGECVGARD
jgi:predicted acylesterase/phospholipase RssA